MLDHPSQPQGSHLRVLFSPAGANFLDERSPENQGTGVAATLKHGRLTISGAGQSDAPPPEYLRNRHIQEMHVVASTPPRLRIELSDMCVDLFNGLSLAELTWTQGVIESELRRHRRRKESAMAKDSLPDRWRYPRSLDESWRWAKGFLLLTAFALCCLASLLCLHEASSALHAGAGQPMETDLKLRLIAWVPAAFVAIAFSVQLALSLCRWHEKPKKDHF